MSETNPPEPSNGNGNGNGNGFGGGYSASGAGSADAGFSGSDSDRSTSDSGESDTPIWVRALYMLGFAILAYCTFWVLIVMAVVQLIVVAIDKKPNDDLRRFAGNLTTYLRELVDYLCFVVDDRPFPFGKFPNVPN